MENKFVISTKKLIAIWIVSFALGLGAGMYKCTQKKYSMNLKCVQGELYEEIRTNMFVKSHLECFEQRTF
jgi:uncharacterized protein HemX